MRRTIVILSLALFLPLIALAEKYRLEGKVGDKYPIVIELTKRSDGTYAGRYAYRSTLNRQGDKPSSWLTISPSYSSPATNWTVYDNDGVKQEDWSNVSFNGKTLTARLKTAKGKYYDVAASTSGAKASPESLSSYFRQHVGDYVYELKMFDEPRIKQRLQRMMGVANYNTLKEVYETQVPIEFSDNMYWSSGFKAHSCCDPAAIWAYNPSTNTFYVWIRRDGKERTWSEDGKTSYEFQELVGSTFPDF